MDNLNLKKSWEEISKSIVEKYKKNESLHFILENTNLKEVYKNEITILTKNKIDEVILNTDFYQIIKNSINSYFKDEFIINIYYEKKYADLILEKERRKKIPPKNNSINRDLSFEELIFSKKNKLIKEATIKVINQKKIYWNPLFIYGRSGLGKTHILHAIGNKIKENNPNKNVKYIEAKDFGNIVTNAMQSSNINNKISEINEQFEKYDILLVDDIQFIKNRKKTKEIFFNIFNYFIQNKKQVVLSSDQDPTELKEFEERFTTRFKGGLLLKIDPPDLYSSNEILKIKIEKNENINIDDFSLEAISWISEHFGQNIRFLEGAINRISLFNILNQGEKITIPYLKEIFKENLPKEKKLTNKTIINAVAKHFGISEKEITSKSRKREITLPRNISIYLIKEINNPYLTEIGVIFQRDHTTIINSLQNIKRKVKYDEQLIHTISTIRKSLNV